MCMALLTNSFEGHWYLLLAFYTSFRQIVEAESFSIYETFKTEFDKVANYYEGLQVI